MQKNYLDARDYLRDVWRLGQKIFDSPWKPDMLVALWRGGAPVGVALHEYLAYRGQDVRHEVVKCRSYVGIGENPGTVAFECADSVFAECRTGMKILVVDDVFDTGRTIAAVKEILDARGAEMRSACVYWKPDKNQTDLAPDYVAKQLDDAWIVFPHEMDGLTREEIAEKDPVLSELI